MTSACCGASCAGAASILRCVVPARPIAPTLVQRLDAMLGALPPSYASAAIAVSLGKRVADAKSVVKHDVPAAVRTPCCCHAPNECAEG